MGAEVTPYAVGDVLVLRVERQQVYERQEPGRGRESSKVVVVVARNADGSYLLKEKKSGRRFRTAGDLAEIWSAKPALRYAVLAHRQKNRKVRAMKKNAVGAPEIRLYANPYDRSASGWYFKTPEEFEDKYEKHLPVEEYELDWIDGPEEDRELFEALNVGPADLETFFDLTDDLRTDEKAALYYLLRYAGHKKSDLAWMLKRVEDEVRVREGTSKEYVYDLVDDLGGVGQLGENAVEMYFDYESFGRDLAMDLEEDDGLSDQERGEEYVDSMGGVDQLGEMAQQHFDFESYARDLELNGDVTEFDFAGTTYTTDYTG